MNLETDKKIKKNFIIQSQSQAKTYVIIEIQRINDD